MRRFVLMGCLALLGSPAAAVEGPVLHVGVVHGWATVAVDGEELGYTPVTMNIAPGEHVVELRSAFHEPWRHTVVVPPRSRMRLDVTLSYRPVTVEIEGDLTDLEVRAQGYRLHVEGGVFALQGLGTFELLFLKRGRPVHSRRINVCTREDCLLPGMRTRVVLPSSPSKAR